ncbi:hypothetical protein QQ045_009574 [Rhodiola kirilowii]
MDQILNSRLVLGSTRRLTESSILSAMISIQCPAILKGAKWLVKKIKGKVQKPLPELVKEYNLPVGKFPCDATNY